MYVSSRVRSLRFDRMIFPQKHSVHFRRIIHSVIRKITKFSSLQTLSVGGRILNDAGRGEGRVELPRI